MAKIDRFEDLKSWQKARALANQIYDLTKQRDFSNEVKKLINGLLSYLRG